MSPDLRTPDDKLDIHHRQQLSALVDGELSPDEARFLLRRLQHDAELAGSFERWQLGGDVLRGRVRRAAAPDLSARVARAIASESPVADARPAVAAAGRRRGLVRWGGGAALAASVAAAALMVGGRQQELPAPDASPAVAVASQALAPVEARLPPAPVEAPPASTPAAAAAVAIAAVPVAAAPRRAVAPATTVSDPIATVAAAPLPAVAGVEATVVPSAVDPFASATPLHARPWPRDVLASPGAGFTASFGEPAAPRPFYPFEPDPGAVPAPVDDAGGPPAPQEDDGG